MKHPPVPESPSLNGSEPRGSDIESDTQAKPWLKLPAGAGAGGKNETGRNFDAFECYRQQPVGKRSLAETARQQGKSIRLIEKWSSLFHWVERTAAWDLECARVRAEAQLKSEREEAEKWARRRHESRERSYQGAMKLMAKGEQILDFPLAKKVVNNGTMVVHPVNFKLADAAKFLKVGSETARQALGEAATETDLRDEIWEVEPYVSTRHRDEDPVANFRT